MHKSKKKRAITRVLVMLTVLATQKSVRSQGRTAVSRGRGATDSPHTDARRRLPANEWPNLDRR